MQGKGHFKDILNIWEHKLWEGPFIILLYRFEMYSFESLCTVKMLPFLVVLDMPVLPKMKTQLNIGGPQLFKGVYKLPKCLP